MILKSLAGYEFTLNSGSLLHFKSMQTGTLKDIIKFKNIINQAFYTLKQPPLVDILLN